MGVKLTFGGVNPQSIPKMSMMEPIELPHRGDLKISSSLSLPSDAVTRTFGILAVRGAGKSNTGAVMAEEMFRARLPFVVIDPVGSWWGLRSSGDGKGPGLAVPIFGSKHGDLPLERASGEQVANVIAEKRLSCVLDLSGFDSEADKKAFLLAFARRLYSRNEDPLHLFLEEADDYIPQRPMRDEAQLLRAWENIVRRGRSRGLGMTLITQRSAALNKMVLTQVETLIVLRTTGPQDQKAIEAWLEYHQQKREIMASLSGLDDGEAWIWSPQWLKLMKRIQVRRRWTFDSGATPANIRSKEGRSPTTLADVDLAILQAEFKSSIEKAKADDPRELRRKIAQLESELETARRESPAKLEKVEVPILGLKSVSALDGLMKAAERLLGEREAIVGQLSKAVQDLHTAADRWMSKPGNIITPKRQAPAASRMPSIRPKSVHVSNATSNGDVGSGGLRRILTALAQKPNGLSTRQIGVWARLSSKSGSFNTYLSTARSRGWISGERNLILITDAGRQALGSYEPLPCGEALLEYWMHELGTGGAARILSLLAAAYPAELHKSQVAEGAGLSGNSGSFNTYLSKLRTLELIHGRSQLRASDEFFEV